MVQERNTHTFPLDLLDCKINGDRRNNLTIGAIGVWYAIIHDSFALVENALLSGVG